MTDNHEGTQPHDFSEKCKLNVVRYTTLTVLTKPFLKA